MWALQVWHSGLVPHSMWNLSSLTRDQTPVSCIAVDSLSDELPEKLMWRQIKTQNLEIKYIGVNLNTIRFDELLIV